MIKILKLENLIISFLSEVKSPEGIIFPHSDSFIIDKYPVYDASIGLDESI